MIRLYSFLRWEKYGGRKEDKIKKDIRTGKEQKLRAQNGKTKWCELNAPINIILIDYKLSTLETRIHKVKALSFSLHVQFCLFGDRFFCYDMVSLTWPT